MTNIELKSKISEYEAERGYARNRAEDSSGQEQEIWEIIESAYKDLVFKLNNLVDNSLSQYNKTKD